MKRILAANLLVLSLCATAAAQGTPATPPKTPPAAPAPATEPPPPPAPPAAPEVAPPPAEEVPEPTPLELSPGPVPAVLYAAPPAPETTEEPRVPPTPLKTWATGGTILDEDIQPSASVLRAEGVDVHLGALAQVQFAPYVGSEALVSNGDAASEVGFRIRRTRIGLDAQFKYNLGVFVTLDLLANSADDGIVSDAKLTWSPAKEFRFAVGSGKVPFSRGSLASSRTLPLIDRPLSVTTITPGRRLGATAEGSFWDEHIAYLVGAMNGTDGFGPGNQFGGFLLGARLEFRAFGVPNSQDPSKNGLAVGGGVLYDKGPATNTVAWSADIYGALWNAFLTAEVLCNNIKPDDAPLVAAGVSSSIKRCGGYAEGGYTFRVFDMAVQPVLRGELFDDNTSLDDAGDVIFIGGGVNVQVVEQYVRAQLHYLARIERHGAERSNDTLVLALQGSF